MIRYDSEPNYDIRKLPVGGWISSQISVQSHGRWIQFFEPGSNNIINSTLPIDYSKKYKPPIVYKKNKNKSEKINDDSFFNDTNKNDFFESQKINVPPIELSPERVSTIMNENSQNNDGSLVFSPKYINSSKSLKRSNSSFKDKQNLKMQNSKNISPAIDKSSFIHDHKVIFDETEIPKTTRIQKRKFESKKSLNRSIQTSRTDYRSKTSFKPRKTYLGEYNDESIMVVYGYKPKTAYKNGI